MYLPIAVIFLGLTIGMYRAFNAGNLVLGGNALASLVAICIPLLLDIIILPQVESSIHIGPVLPLWIAVAGGLHSIGMTTIYERIWWWDHLTHLVSASLIGAVVYGGLLAIDAEPTLADLGWPTIAGVTVGITLLAGVFWELIELVGRDIASSLGREPLLVPYDRLDTTLDLVVDLIGPIMILLLDIRMFVDLWEQSPITAEIVLTWVTAVLLVGSVVFGAWHLWYHRDRYFQFS